MCGRELRRRAASMAFEIEAIGPVLILHDFEHLLSTESLWIHYIDNDAALATLVHGSSSVVAGDVIAAYTHSRLSVIGLWPWLDRVASFDLVDIQFPPR